MVSGKRFGVVLGVGLLAGVFGLSAPRAGDDKKAAGAGPLVVVDHAGKEHRLKTWQFVGGTRRLTWLAPPAAAPEQPAKKGKKGGAARALTGPEALVFTEGKSAPLVNAVRTLVLLEHIRAIEFDAKKGLVTVRVVTGDKAEDDLVLTGVTGYVGVNVLAIEAEADLGELGTATAQFQGGVANGVRSVRFPAPKPAPAAPVRPDRVTTRDKGKTVHHVLELRPLYRLADGTSRTAPTLLFRKTLKLDVTKIDQMTQVGGEGKAGGLNFEVTLKGGKQAPLVLLSSMADFQVEGQRATLEGLVGREPAGFKLFPPAVIAAVQFGGEVK
jgi:hypothetical protein